MKQLSGFVRFRTNTAFFVVRLASALARVSVSCLPPAFDALADYAHAYAEHIASGYRAWMQACRAGRLEARKDEDLAGDFRA
ncbi:hypothetical protein [Pararobbsia silviterrae]|uniref:hypothetical protein n=1 Tax=Pararobbsia silviterrae TaxID=1792498 RepID=UPI001314A125|nr:hypothetical protein [Pararobbsia silviterrae]